MSSADAESGCHAGVTAARCSRVIRTGLGGGVIRGGFLSLPHCDRLLETDLCHERRETIEGERSEPRTRSIVGHGGGGCRVGAAAKRGIAVEDHIGKQSLRERDSVALLALVSQLADYRLTAVKLPLPLVLNVPLRDNHCATACRGDHDRRGKDGQHSAVRGCGP